MGQGSWGGGVGVAGVGWTLLRERADAKVFGRLSLGLFKSVGSGVGDGS